MLAEIITELRSEADLIADERKVLLSAIAQRLAEAEKPLALHFICTHNSRRSQLAQVWAKAAAHYAGWSKQACYSGGTEATKVPAATLAALKASGFVVGEVSGENQPVDITYATSESPLQLFSKRFDDAANPTADFLALMTCDDAASNCPFVPGSAGRYALTYEDPKKSDGTAQEAATYLARSRQIGREMVYLFDQLSASEGL